MKALVELLKARLEIAALRKVLGLYVTDSPKADSLDHLERVMFAGLVSTGQKEEAAYNSVLTMRYFRVTGDLIRAASEFENMLHYATVTFDIITTNAIAEEYEMNVSRRIDVLRNKLKNTGLSSPIVSSLKEILKDAKTMIKMRNTVTHWHLVSFPEGSKRLTFKQTVLKVTKPEHLQDKVRTYSLKQIEEQALKAEALVDRLTEVTRQLQALVERPTPAVQ